MCAPVYYYLIPNHLTLSFFDNTKQPGGYRKYAAMVRPTRRSSLLGRRLIFVPTSKSVAPPPSPLFYIYVYSLVTNDITVHSGVTRFLSLLSSPLRILLLRTSPDDHSNHFIDGSIFNTLTEDRIHICFRIRQGEERERERNWL